MQVPYTSLTRSSRPRYKNHTTKHAKSPSMNIWWVSFYYCRSSITFWAWKNLQQQNFHFLDVSRQVQDSLRSIAIQQKRVYGPLTYITFEQGSKQQSGKKLCENNRHLNFHKNATKSWEKQSDGILILILFPDSSLLPIQVRRKSDDFDFCFYFVHFLASFSRWI
jgi:hypothetical protein